MLTGSRIHSLAVHMARLTRQRIRPGAGVAGLLAIATLACGSPGAGGASSSPSGVASPRADAAGDHHCADLLAQSEVQLAPVKGVWNCLEPAVQETFNGTGDRAVAGSSGYFLAPVTLIGCDEHVCVYSLPLEATTAATSGTSETTLTVWLDGGGLVAYAAIPKPER